MFKIGVYFISKLLVIRAMINTTEVVRIDKAVSSALWSRRLDAFVDIYKLCHDRIILVSFGRNLQVAPDAVELE